MKTFLSKILDEQTNSSRFTFKPQINIPSSKSTLHWQIEPNDPYTASNIVINTFISKTNRSIVPIKVQWSRYKFKSNEQYTIQKIPSIIGNTYLCQPSDLGSVIQAKIKSLDPMIIGEAQATIGPIRIDAMLKRLIDGALYNESLLSQVILIKGQQKLNINFRLYKRTMEFQQMMNSSEKLVMNYSFSQPKIELSPKDPCKVYLRFEQDLNNSVKNWLNKIFEIEKSRQLNESSLSVKVPHSNVSAVSSKTKLFQKSHVHCINKMQIQFLSRNSRDLFLFTLRAFVCKQDMKNSIVIEKIQTLQALKSEQDFHKFLEYISLKSEIIRLAEIAKQIQNDRDNKIKDINHMEESISEMTLTYLKIIEEKSQNQQVDLEQSYSMISMKREQILGRKNFRELKNQNQKLKANIRDLNEQLQLQKFFRRQDNESMMFNQTQNPFLKKNNLSNIVDQNQSANYIINGAQSSPTHKNLLEISKSYLKVLEENKKLKSIHQNSPKTSRHNESHDIQNLLESLHQSEQQEKKFSQMQAKIENYEKELKQQKDNNRILTEKLNQMNNIQNFKLNNNSKDKIEYSYYSRAESVNNSIISNSISMNQSMTSEAEINLLQKKLIQLSNLNTKFQAENTRLRKQRDYYRSSCESMIKIKQKVKSQNHIENSKIIDNYLDNDKSLLLKYRQEKQQLQNQKNTLLKKINSLTRQSNGMISEKKCKQLAKQNQRLMQQNQKLQKNIQNIKNFHELQKKQLQKFKYTSVSTINGNTSQSTQIKEKQEEISKIKKINQNLLDQIKELKKLVEKKSDLNLESSRVIQLRNQVQILQNYHKGHYSIAEKQYISAQTFYNSPAMKEQQLQVELIQIKKQNQRLREQIDHLELKIDTQTKTIEKLMTQLDEPNESKVGSDDSFNKKYLRNGLQNQSRDSQRQNNEKKIVQLQKQLLLLRRNSDAFNRRRDLSMSMIGYDQQRMQLFKRQNQNLMVDNEKLSKLCSKYGKQARQSLIQIKKLKQKIMELNKERLNLQQI